MQKKIENIPAVLYGNNCDSIIIAVHGAMSNKEDVVIKLFHEIAEKKGYQVLAIDLPEHGERNDGVKLTPWNCVSELESVYNWCQKEKKIHISLFACSIGAYMSLLAFQDKKIEHCWLLSPVVDMELLIKQMMYYNNVSEIELKEKEIIMLDNGQELSWEYLKFVSENPIVWKNPIDIIWGRADDITSENSINKFALLNNAKVCKVDSEHYFHTEKQLNIFKEWLNTSIE